MAMLETTSSIVCIALSTTRPHPASKLENNDSVIRFQEPVLRQQSSSIGFLL